MKHKKLWIGGILAVMITALLTGCGATQDGKVSEATYLATMAGKFQTLTTAAKDIETKLDGFSEASLSDEAWCSEMQSNLDILKTGCQEIVDYTGTPDNYTELQTTISGVASQAIPAIDEYKAGITNKDFNALQKANSQLEAASASMNDYVTQLKDTLTNAQ